MPRANRYIQPGCLYHLTHRCHDRKFLFRFVITRNEYRNRLRNALREFRVSMLAYCITSNHTHLLVEAADPGGISVMMQKLEGQFAEWYNWRKHRSGAFWGDRYHCTLVDGAEHALNCMKYIDLNMFRAGVVKHPREWRWCGYDELSGKRKRYRLVNREAVLKWQGHMRWDRFVEDYKASINLSIDRQEIGRKAIWTECLAVGSAEFTQRINQQIKNRIRLEREKTDDGVWTVKESIIPYVPI
jgi:putative transposase